MGLKASVVEAYKQAQPLTLHVLTSAAFGALDFKASVEARVVTGTAPHLEQLLASSESAQSACKQSSHSSDHLVFNVHFTERSSLFYGVKAAGWDFHSSTLNFL